VKEQTAEGRQREEEEKLVLEPADEFITLHELAVCSCSGRATPYGSSMKVEQRSKEDLLIGHHIGLTLCLDTPS
jgi:hypothetical protein